MNARAAGNFNYGDENGSGGVSPERTSAGFRFGAATGEFDGMAAGALARELRWRWAKAAIVCIGLILGGWYFGSALVDLVHADMAARGADGFGFVTAAITAFVVASATPFVPGAEIGLGLMIMLGAKIAILVYASMVAALTLSFLIGRMVPAARIAALFAYLGLGRARDLVLRLAPLAPQDRLDLLADKLPNRLAPMLLRHRYLALIVLFNLPGNSVIGGGGGIGFTAGLSGLYTLPAYFAAVLVSVAPVPLCVLVMG